MNKIHLQEFSVRRRLNSDTFETLHMGSSDMYSKSSILSSIYGHGKLSLNNDDSGETFLTLWNFVKDKLYSTSANVCIRDLNLTLVKKWVWITLDYFINHF